MCTDFIISNYYYGALKSSVNWNEPGRAKKLALRYFNSTILLLIITDSALRWYTGYVITCKFTGFSYNSTSDYNLLSFTHVLFFLQKKFLSNPFLSGHIWTKTRPKKYIIIWRTHAISLYKKKFNNYAMTYWAINEIFRGVSKSRFYFPNMSKQIAIHFLNHQCVVNYSSYHSGANNRSLSRCHPLKEFNGVISWVIMAMTSQLWKTWSNSNKIRWKIFKKIECVFPFCLNDKKKFFMMVVNFWK